MGNTNTIEECDENTAITPPDEFIVERGEIKTGRYTQTNEKTTMVHKRLAEIGPIKIIDGSVEVTITPHPESNARPLTILASILMLENTSGNQMRVTKIGFDFCGRWFPVDVTQLNLMT